MPNIGLNSNVGAVIKFMPGKKTFYDTQKKTHGDTDRKFIITTLTNTHYKPEIFKPKTWVPPMEARPRNIIRLNITTPKKTFTGIHREKTYPQTQTLNNLNGQPLLQHSYSRYTRPAAMNFYQNLISHHRPPPAPFSSTEKQTRTGK